MTETTTPVVAEPDSPRLPRPRIRAGAAIWGCVLLAAGAAALWTGSSSARRADVVARLVALDGAGWTILAVVVVGALLTLVALAAVIRSVQRRLSSGRRARSDAAPRPESP